MGLAEKSEIFHIGRNSFGVSLWLNAAIEEKLHGASLLAIGYWHLANFSSI
jgi:hypothetical protein